MIFPGNNGDTFAVVRTLPIQVVEGGYVEFGDSDQRIFHRTAPPPPSLYGGGGHPLAELTSYFQYYITACM